MNYLVYHFLTPMDLPHKIAAHPPSKVVSSKYSPLMVAWSFPLILFYDTVQQSPKYTNTLLEHQITFVNVALLQNYP